MKLALHIAALALPLAGLAGSAPSLALGGDNGVMVMRGKQKVTPGSGRMARERRALRDFESIVADDAVDVSVAVGGTYGVEAEADDNLLRRLTTRVEDGVLRIGLTGSYSARQAPLVRLSMPELRQIDLHASSSATVTGMQGARLDLNSNGSGNFRVEGWVPSLRVEMSGSGEADLAGLRADYVVAIVNGSGGTDVNAARTLFAEVNGTGWIRYRGTAEIVRAAPGQGSIRAAGR